MELADYITIYLFIGLLGFFIGKSFEQELGALAFVHIILWWPWFLFCALREMYHHVSINE